MSALAADRLQMAEHYFTPYAVVLPTGATLEEALKADYWAHVAEKLRQHDTIRLIPEDGSYFAEALVLAAGRGFAKLKLLRHVALEEEPGETVPEGLEVKWRGPHLRWSVIRRSDSTILKDRLAEKIDAIREAAGSLAV